MCFQKNPHILGGKSFLHSNQYNGPTVFLVHLKVLHYLVYYKHLGEDVKDIREPSCILWTKFKNTYGCKK